MAIGLGALLAAEPCASADTNARAVLAAGGFFGRWAVDCAAPESDQMVISSNKIGEVLVTQSLGAGASRYRILAAQARGSLYEMESIWLGDGRTLHLTFERDRARLRVTRSIGGDGEVFVDRGVGANGQVNAWYLRCGD